MGLIKKSNEILVPRTIKVMLYGQAGFGKTTLALSTPKPLLLDFDNGVKRVNMEHLNGVDIVQIEKWDNVYELLREDLSSYNTIVVDTIGKMMDFIISYKCGTRQPQIRDWSGINQEFSTFVRNLSDLNKNIVFVAHRDTRKEGDETIFIPSLREKSYNSIVTELDLLGYMEMKQVSGKQVRTITFDPTSRSDGKNTCNLPSVMNIPTITDKNGKCISPNNFITEQVIKPYLAMIDIKAEERKKYDAIIEQIKEDIQQITDVKSAEEFSNKIGQYEHIGSSIDMARSLFGAKIRELGITYNKETKAYETV